MSELSTEVLEAPGSLPAPQSYALLVLSSVASQSEQARRLARSAAVLADGTPFSLVAALAEVDEPEEALEELTRRRCSPARRPTRVGGSVSRTRWSGRPCTTTSVHSKGRRRTSERPMLCEDDQALFHRLAASSGPDPELAAELAARAGQLHESGDLRQAADYYLKAGHARRPRGLAVADGCGNAVPDRGRRDSRQGSRGVDRRRRRRCRPCLPPGEDRLVRWTAERRCRARHPGMGARRRAGHAWSRGARRDPGAAVQHAGRRTRRRRLGRQGPGRGPAARPGRLDRGGGSGRTRDRGSARGRVGRSRGPAACSRSRRPGRAAPTDGPWRRSCSGGRPRRSLP